MNLKRTFDVSLSLLTPLHIGSGKELLRDYDYVTHNGRTWVMNADAFLEYLQKPDGSFDERLVGRPAAELLTDRDFDVQNSHQIFRYTLPGQPRAQGYGAVLREQYKDVLDRPYIPGSSLKGALRTILTWHGYQAQKLTLDVGAIQSGRSWAGQGTERKIFGSEPNLDLLRALQVADSQPQGQETLQIVNAQVVTGGEKFGSPIEVEAVKVDTTFQTTLTLDEFLHSPSAEAKLHFAAKWEWLEALPQIARQWAEEQLTKECEWFKVRKYHNVGKLYHNMLGFIKRKQLPANSFFLQIGWGGGWTSKTIGYPLQQDSKAWERLLNDKRLSPARIRRKEGDPFPKSRRAVVANQQVMTPLGWCLVEMKERK